MRDTPLLRSVFVASLVFLVGSLLPIWHIPHGPSYTWLAEEGSFWRMLLYLQWDYAFSDGSWMTVLSRHWADLWHFKLLCSLSYFCGFVTFVIQRRHNEKKSTPSDS